MNSVRSNKSSLKYQKCTPLGYKDIGIRYFELMPKTHFISNCTAHFFLLTMKLSIKLLKLEHFVW